MGSRIAPAGVIPMPSAGLTVYIFDNNLTLMRIPWKINVSPRFELVLALWSVLSERARRHAGWRRMMRGRLPAEFGRAIEALGGSPELWILFFDAPGRSPLEKEVSEVVASIRRRPASELARGLLGTLLHDERLGADLFACEISIEWALAALPRRKREWLGFMGLYPYAPDRPMAKAVQRMIEDSDGFRRDSLTALDSFAETFAGEWRRLRPQLERSAGEARKLLAEGDWPAIGRSLGLNIEFDLARQQMRALRGGYALAFAELGEAIFLPSAFNELQFWTVVEDDGGKSDPLIPWLDPSIRLSLESAELLSEPSLVRDAALVFRALGDATRFAMAALLARRPMSSAELGRQLSLSKPTVAHHVHELRQAGLLQEQNDGKAVILSLDRAAIEGLSAAASAQLFERKEAPALARSRRRS
jgi:DNA-binding transcriptional ArsR family regulator